MLERTTFTYTGKPDDLAPTPQRREAWARDKFFIVRNLLPKEPLVALAEKTLAEYGQRPAQPLGGSLSGHINFSTGEFGRQIAQMMRDRGLIDLIDELHGQQMEWDASGGNLNLPGSHRQHYHMDSNYHDEFIAVMVSLVPTSLQNGAIELFAESFQRRWKYAEFITSDLPKKGFRPTMGVGDILVRSSCVWHRGMPNLTQTPRPWLTYGMRPKGAVNAKADPFAGNGVEFKSNFYTAGWKGKVKENLVVHAHWLYSAMRAVRSLSAAPDSAS